MNKTHFILGGDLKRSLSDGYSLDFKPLFKDALAITRANYLSLTVACFVTISVVTIAYLLSFEKLTELDEISQILINFTFSAFVITPLITGLQMMGIHHAIGLKTRSSDVFNYFNNVTKLATASVLINIIIYALTFSLSQLFGDIGAQFSLVIILYLNMAFTMVYPFVAEKKISPQLAIKLSFKLINKNLRQFTLLFLLLALLAILAVIPSGLGLLLFIPFYFNIMGIVYRQLCGVGVVATEVTDKEDDDDSSDNGSNNSSDFEA